MEVLGLQEERQDLLATEQDVMVLQLAEDSPQRTKHPDDVHGDGVDNDAEVTRVVLLKEDESSEA